VLFVHFLDFILRVSRARPAYTIEGPFKDSESQLELPSSILELALLLKNN